MRYWGVVTIFCSIILGCSSSHEHALPSPFTGAEIIDLGVGTVELPKGFSHTQDQGADSRIGHFTSADGHLAIHYDIGFFAGVDANITNVDGVDVVLSTNMIVNGKTALIVETRRQNLRSAVVSFPGVVPVNFYARIRDHADFETVKALASTYRAKPR